MSRFLESLEDRRLLSNTPPIAVHDATSAAGWVSGWTFDPSTPNDSIAVHMYVDGKLEAGVLAGSPRDDVNRVYGISGNHGFGWQLPQKYMDGRNHTVQVWAIDSQGGTNVAAIHSGKVFANAAPIGVHDATSSAGWVSGWAFDSSTPNDSIAVHVYVDGKLEAGVLAGSPRDDVNRVYGISGNHGFGWQLPQKYMDGQKHTVQVWSIDSQGGINVAAVHTGKVFANAAPIGVHDATSVTGWVSGWAFDSSTPNDSIAVHVYVDGKLEAGVLAGNPRDDVNRVYGISGNHGFGWQLPQKYMDGQKHTVQVWSIDSQGGINVVTVNSGTAYANAAPVGVHDATSASGWVSGWAYDPSTPNDSIGVHIYVDGNMEAGISANGPRDDVNRVYSIGGNHGYGWQLPQKYMDGKPHVVHVYGIDSQGGKNTTLSGTGKTFQSAAPAPVTPRAGSGWSANDPPANGIYGKPYRHVGTITTFWKSRKPDTGTGFLVGRQHVMTAGHVLFDKETGESPIAVMFTPGGYDGRAPFGSANAVKWAVAKPYLQGKNFGSRVYDYGVMKLNRPLGDRTLGWFTLQEWARGWDYDVQLSGYTPSWNANKSQVGRTVRTESPYLYSDIRWVASGPVAAGGQSGSPAYFFKDGRYRVVGLMFGNDPFGQVNGVKFNTTVRREMQDWINRNP